MVYLLLNLRGEGNGTHDAVAELLVYDALEGVPVVLDDLIQAVDQGLHGRHGAGAAPVGEASHGGVEALPGHAQDRRELRDVRVRRLRLAVEQRGDRDLAASQLVGDLLECELLGRLGVEERLRVGRKPVDETRLGAC